MMGKRYIRRTVKGTSTREGGPTVLAIFVGEGKASYSFEFLAVVPTSFLSVRCKFRLDCFWPCVYMLAFTLAGDGHENPNGKCTNCKKSELECTYKSVAMVTLMFALSSQYWRLHLPETSTPERIYTWARGPRWKAWSLFPSCEYGHIFCMIQFDINRNLVTSRERLEQGFEWFRRRKFDSLA